MSKLRSMMIRWRKLTGPAPINDFSDYNEYWSKRGGTSLIYRRWKIACEHIEDGSSVLDVGCGNGEFLQYLRSIRPSVRMHGIDVSSEAVARARAAGLDASVVDIGCDDIEGEFDYVTCFELLEHIPDAKRAIQRLARAFRKKLIVSVPNVGYIGCRVRLGIFGRFPVTNCIMHIKEHVRHWTPIDFREWAGCSGLQVTRCEGQYGIYGTPWRMWPSLFANGMIYIMKHQDQQSLQHR